MAREGEVVIPFIEGDGVGPEIWAATRPVLEAAIRRASGGRVRIRWEEVLAGEKAFRQTGEWLPRETLETIRRAGVAIKGPLTTPVGGGIRSLNVTIRQELNLYACVRPVRWFPGVPSPLREPHKVNMVIFRENTEDVYAGLEWSWESPEARRIREWLYGELRVRLREDAGIGLKPISREGTRRIARSALRYALATGRQRATVVHKGNIMKFTEGAFRAWTYELAREEFGEKVVTEEELGEGSLPPGKVLLNDRLADNMFQQILLRPEDYQVLICPNLNGDYLSDALAGAVGGLGLAPGANIGDDCAVFEATHGTAPRHAGKDRVNPGSLLLSGAMMLEHLGWPEAARLVVEGVAEAIARGTVTYDLARGREGVQVVGTRAFGEEVLKAVEG